MTTAASAGRVRILCLGLALGLALGVSECDVKAPAAIARPVEDQLSGPAVPVRIELAGSVDPADVRVELDGTDVTAQLAAAAGELSGTLLGVAPGEHELTVRVASSFLGTRVPFETVALAGPDFDPAVCELFNAVECLLPYPSSRFLEPDPGTPSGQRLAIPQIGIPEQNGADIPASIFTVRDGFTPGAQVLMHFPQGVDLAASGASRLQENLQRSTDLTSVSPDSPTLLIDWDTGERVLHWLENDVREGDDPSRRVLFLRPGRSLTPGHRYIVAMRDSLVSDAGEPVRAESVFAALRDGRPTTLPDVEAQRGRLEAIFARLEALGVAREDLVLAFDFRVASDENLTGQMLSMRDQAFDWLAAQDQGAAPTFTVDHVLENDCSVPGTRIWKEVRGTFQVPLFLTSDPEADAFALGFLRVAADGVTPVSQGVTNPPYGIAIPCAALEPPGERPIYPTVLGHGLFGNGPEFVLGDVPDDEDPNPQGVSEALVEADDEFGIGMGGEFDYITGGTSWRGLSDADIEGEIGSFVVAQILFNLHNFPALPARLRQGMLNQLLLTRMMRRGDFNAHPAFQAPAGHGVFRPDEEMFYFGASLGGIMGLMFAALTPDVHVLNADVPAINFNCLLQRATPFTQFQDLLDLTIGSDTMVQILGLSLVAELWAPGESVGYATHITEDPLPGVQAKEILMTMAWLDQQVSNQCTEIAARTLELPQLEGSLLSGLPQIPDQSGPLASAFVVYDTGGLDPDDPAHADIVPPLGNLPAEINRCDPHGRRQFIPASLRQLAGFLRPGGSIENFCDGRCDADFSVTEVGPMGAEFRLETPQGEATPCDPFPEEE